MVAAVAAVEPQMAEKAAQAATVAMARPPRRLPSHLFAKSNRSDDMPDIYANCPINTNSGMTAKE